MTNPQKSEVDRIRAKIKAQKKAAEAASQNGGVESSLKKQANRRPKKLSSGTTLEATTASSRIEREHAPSQKMTTDTAVADAAAKLKDSELAVVENYLADPARNQTAAYLKVHPQSSRKAAYVSAHRLLRKPKILAYLVARREQLNSELEITPERVLGRLATIGFANAGDYFAWGPEGIRVKPQEELDREDQAVVLEVSQTTTAHGGTIRIKLQDQVAALELLGKHLELFTDKRRHEAGDTWTDLLREIHDCNDRRRSAE